MRSPNNSPKTVIKGIIGARSLIGQRIAAQSAELSKRKKGSQLDAEHLMHRVCEAAVEQLRQTPEEEVWLIAASSDLRKPYAEAMAYLMQVRNLDECQATVSSLNWADPILHK